MWINSELFVNFINPLPNVRVLAMPGPTYKVSVLGTGYFCVEGSICGSYEDSELLAEAIATHVRLGHGPYRVENIPAANADNERTQLPLHIGVFCGLAEHIDRIVKQ